MTKIGKVKSLEEAVAHFEMAGVDYAECTRREMELQAKRHVAKSEAISRIMGLDDPQKPGKKYSATAAAEVVQTDAAYSLHLQDESDAAANTIIARTKWYGYLAIMNQIATTPEIPA